MERDATFDASTKTPRKTGYSTWTAEELQVLYSYPELSSIEMAELLPKRTPKAIRDKRRRDGRWNHLEWCVCGLCHSRPIWVESKRAAFMRLCKGCYIKEMERRISEDKAANALRQSEFKLRRKQKQHG